MKVILIGVVVIGLLGAGYFYLLALRSKAASPPGLVDGFLAGCSAQPNCLCSEKITRVSHHMAAWSLPQQPVQDSVAQLIGVVEAAGGEMVTVQDDYLAAIFTSSFFGFVDDLEFRLDAQEQKVFFRAASRVGRSDFGVNRKRIEHLKSALRERGWP